MKIETIIANFVVGCEAQFFAKVNPYELVRNELAYKIAQRVIEKELWVYEVTALQNGDVTHRAIARIVDPGKVDPNGNT